MFYLHSNMALVFFSWLLGNTNHVAIPWKMLLFYLKRWQEREKRKGLDEQTERKRSKVKILQNSSKENQHSDSNKISQMMMSLFISPQVKWY